MLNLSSFVIYKIHSLTDSKEHLRLLVIDDSSYYRNRSTKVEQLSWQYDHAANRSFKGFRMLTLGFTDGFSFIPIDFALLSGSKQLQGHSTDLRTSGGKRAAESNRKATQVSLEMVERALNKGIIVTHILMDKWFTKPAFLTSLKEIGIEAIGMVANTRTLYKYNGKYMNLAGVFAHSKRIEDSSNALSYAIVKFNNSVNAKIVFVKNNNKRSEWLAIMTTDLTLTHEKIIQSYSVRWGIETFFKASKSLLNLAKETQTRNYNALICHTTVVFVRYIILSWQHRCTTDDRTIDGLFEMLSDGLRELDWVLALTQLVKLITEIINDKENEVQELIKNQLKNWYETLPNYIKEYLPNLVCES